VSKDVVFTSPTMLVSSEGHFMLESKVRERAETLFDGNQKREKEIGDALKQEAARHDAAVANMHRLRALRLARSAQPSSDKA
jgi:hypothetical protein